MAKRKQSGKIVPVEALSNAKIENIASRLHLKYCPGVLDDPGPIPVLKLFEGGPVLKDYGFEYAVADLGPRVEGEVDCENKLCSISADVYEKLDRDYGRARFSTMHEISHVVLHAKQIRGRHRDLQPVRKYQRSTLPSYRDPEWQADSLASALLMPANHIQALLNEGADKYDIAEIFAVSYRAAEVRMKKIGQLYPDGGNRAS